MAADTIDITWNGVTLSHEGPYRVADLTGWEDLPGGRIDAVARPNRHGAFDAPIWAEARTVSVDGYCIDPDARDTLLQDLAAAAVYTGDAVAGTLSVTFAGRTLTASARLARSARSLKYWGVGHFGFAIDWWCPDPFRYGEQATGSTGLPDDSSGLVFPLFDGTSLLTFGAVGSLGRITMTNPGTADCYPQFDVLGPLDTGFELLDVGSGRRLRYEGVIPTGVHVVLDSRTGTASYDGVPGYDGHLTVRQWWTIPAAGSSVVQLSTLGSSDPAVTLSATWKPTYW